MPEYHKKYIFCVARDEARHILKPFSSLIVGTLPFTIMNGSKYRDFLEQSSVLVQSPHNFKYACILNNTVDILRERWCILKCQS